MGKKSMIVTLMLILCLPILVFTQSSIAEAQGFEFKDVPKGTWGYDEIHYLNQNKIQTGYEDGSFRPNDSLTRAQAAVIMTNALGARGAVSGQSFSDVKADFWAYTAIERASELGIFQGRDGKFHPSERISRAQVATILSRAFSLTGTSSSSFSDISSSFWASADIAALEQNGIIERTANFSPNSQANRGQFAAYVARTIEPSLRLAVGDTVLYKGTVVNTTTTLNVRSLPNGTVIGRLNAGATVDVYGQEGNWLKIKHGTSFAYVHKDYIQRVSGSVTPPPTTAPPSTNKEVIAEGKVTASSLNVRKGPSASSETVGRLSSGEIVSIYEYEGKWALIKFKGDWAYTHIDYLVTRKPGSKGIQGVLIAIDPGHGGKDPGAVANGLREKDVVLSVGLLVNEKLKDKGAKTIMTRNNDTFIELNDRAKIANDAKADIFISIHANAATSTATGLESFWNKTYSSEDSKALAEKINKRLVDELGMRDRGVKEANFAVIRQTTMPSVLVELGFITNSNDAAIMKRSDFNEKAANAIIKGIEDYYSW